MSGIKELISQEDITARLDELAAEVDAAYQGEEVVVVCVLKGAFMFFADLVRRLKVPLLLDFVRLASYGSGVESTGKINFTKDMEINVAGRHVLIVEDIVDTGRSLEYLLKVLRLRNPSSVAVCALIDKFERREVDLVVDFPGFRLKKGFVVGYGLDHAERYRELPGVYEIVDPGEAAADSLKAGDKESDS
jgi:hypoxanthine phosphoribosyltransferase